MGFLVLCHPDTVRVVQSSNAPKAPTYNFVKPFIGMYVFFMGKNNPGGHNVSNMPSVFFKNSL